MTSPTSSGEADAPLLRLLTLVTQQMSQDLLNRQHLAGYDDSRSAHHAVFAHIPPEGIRLVDLAERAGVTKQAMSELVVDLERLGYLRRRPDPADGRAKLIELTERGWKIVNSALDAFASMEQELADRLGPTRLRQLRRTLLDMLEHRD
ncbi:MAG: MarR family winged helix-turn-helix transcriptional regulator [Nocardioidaceae bacterium]